MPRETNLPTMADVAELIHTNQLAKDLYYMDYLVDLSLKPDSQIRFLIFLGASGIGKTDRIVNKLEDRNKRTEHEWRALAEAGADKDVLDEKFPHRTIELPGTYSYEFRKTWHLISGNVESPSFFLALEKARYKGERLLIDDPPSLVVHNNQRIIHMFHEMADKASHHVVVYETEKMLNAERKSGVNMTRCSVWGGAFVLLNLTEDELYAKFTPAILDRWKVYPMTRDEQVILDYIVTTAFVVDAPEGFACLYNTILRHHRFDVEAVAGETDDEHIERRDDAIIIILEELFEWYLVKENWRKHGISYRSLETALTMRLEDPDHWDEVLYFLR